MESIILDNNSQGLTSFLSFFWLSLKSIIGFSTSFNSCGCYECVICAGSLELCTSTIIHITNNKPQLQIHYELWICETILLLELAMLSLLYCKITYYVDSFLVNRYFYPSSKSPKVDLDSFSRLLAYCSSSEALCMCVRGGIEWQLLHFIVPFSKEFCHFLHCKFAIQMLFQQYIESSLFSHVSL